MKKNNKAFTLVELLIAVAIFSMVFAVASSVMIFTSKSFVKANADADIQREAQLVVDQVGDMVIDATGDVDFVVNPDNKELVLYNQQNDGSYLKECVIWNSSDDTLTYSKYKAEYDATHHTFLTKSAIATNELLAEKVKNFDVDLSDVRRETDDKGNVRIIVKSVQVSMNYEDENGKVSYATTPIITLRNRMLMVGSEKDVEPPVVYELSVRVNLAEVGEFDHDQNVNPTDPEYMPNLRLRCVATVIQSGFEDSEIDYQWSVKENWVQIDSKYINNPKECYFTIPKAARKAHLGDTVTMTLTATPPAEKHSPVKDSAIYQVTKYGGEERGEMDKRHDIFIPDYKPGLSAEKTPIAYNLKTTILDERGDVLPHSDYLVNNKLLYVGTGTGSDKEFQNFYCFKSAYLDYSKSYIVEAKYQVRMNFNPPAETDPWYTTRFYVPATRIISENPVCKWTTAENAVNWAGFGVTFQGDEATGDAIRFRTDGFLRESWTSLSPYTIALKDYLFSLKDPKCGLNMDDYIIDLDPGVKSNSISQGTAAKDNIYYIPFKLRVLDKKTNKEVGNEIYKKLNANVIMKEITVTITLDPKKLISKGDYTDIKPDQIPTVSQDIKVRFEHEQL